MVVAGGGVSDAGRREGLRQMQNTHIPATTWPNRKQSQETARQEESTYAETGGYKTRIGHKLSPLKRHCRCRRWKRTASSATRSNKGMGLIGSSPSVPITYNSKESSLAGIGKPDEGTLHISQPLIPFTGNECREILSQTEGAQLGPTQGNYSVLFTSRFAPLQSIGTMREVEANSAECGVKSPEGEKEEESSPFGQVITNGLLREWIGGEDPTLASSAEFRLNTKVLTGVETMGDRMPHLQSLKLNNSYIPQIRLLGTKFLRLKRLWIASSQLESLSGIGVCAPVLEELYAPFNSVHDVMPLLDLSETLEVVDLEGNDIRDASSLMHSLPLLRNVKYLTLQGNPVAISSFTSPLSKSAEANPFTTSSFRDAVRSLMPNLQYLDDVAVNLTADLEAKEAPSVSKGAGKTERTSVHVDPLNVTLSDEYMFLQQCIRECGFDELEAAIAEATRGMYSRPQTSCGEARPRCSALVSSQKSQRPHSSSHTIGRSLAAPNYGLGSACRRPPAGGGGGQITPAPPAASLRTDRVLVNGVVRLRSRLPPLSTATKTSSRVTSGNSCSNQSGTSTGSSIGCGYNSSSLNFPSSASIQAEVPTKGTGKEENGRLSDGNSGVSPLLLAGMEENIETPLFDEAEDEWDMYKQNLLRRMDFRGSAMQRWSKYLGSESAVYCHVDHDSTDSSAFSHTPSTRITSVSSGTGLLQFSQKEQVTVVPEATELCGTITTRQIHDSKTDEAEEDAWREELVRSVVRSRASTARVASDKECLRVGGKRTSKAGELLAVKVVGGNDKSLFIE
ncbi:putative leucine-rich repeat protein (LRRP) [Trypanosoma rangeli]|uniref:Putative leucine-rich repeat protein (LRRP) n=1 Tax=Trypanosoma rangeli TaxID=5698 RepID=A0A422P3D4_TRYRA|nr:putative leucine-rich repeat protein (LRRP) [Trypanosoma rangeli]RNF12175.1 putative leucine-rich repeat protein (LRRP) [Trypanosoma rangeli]|eukprot:RNF12175.1 putative leucine-rich repeat protein (LRRP) [Trypanosoma rangeli]